MPCNTEMYARYEVKADDNEGKFHINEAVLGFALCDDGRVYPLVFDDEIGVHMEEGRENFIEFEVGEHMNRKLLDIACRIPVHED